MTFTMTTTTQTTTRTASSSPTTAPVHNNNNKSSCSTPSTPSLKRRPPYSSSDSSSFLDCQSLQSSLKRVRLSCSPGELRLQRDLRTLVSEQGWNLSQDNCWILDGVARLKQLDDDPLRLVLQLSQNNASVWIQIPRRY